MKSKIFVACCFLIVGALCLSIAPAQEEKPKKEKFSALAYLPSGAGPMMAGAGLKVNVDLYIDSYTSDAEAKTLAGVLREGGSEALLKALEKGKSIGKIRLNGRAGFYDFKLIRSHRMEGGRRVFAVGDRPVGFLEAYYSGRSRDYEFGILQLDLKQNSKGKEEGSGALLYAAKIKVIDGNSIQLESYGIDAVRLMGVRKL